MLPWEGLLEEGTSGYFSVNKRSKCCKLSAKSQDIWAPRWTSWLWDCSPMAPQFIHSAVTSGLCSLLTCLTGSLAHGCSHWNSSFDPALHGSFPGHTHVLPIFFISAKVSPLTRLLVLTKLRTQYCLLFLSHSTYNLHGWSTSLYLHQSLKAKALASIWSTYFYFYPLLVSSAKESFENINLFVQYTVVVVVLFCYFFWF